jgi:PAS domain S-box-containing protein
MAYLVTLGALIAAVLLRWALDPLMGDTLPLVTLFGAVALAVWVGGYRPAVLVVVLGYVACAYLFIEPRGSVAMADPRHFTGLAAYLFTCAIIVAFGEALRAAQRRAEVGRESLRTTLASIGDAVIATDRHGRVTSMNTVAESLTGWSAVDAHGKPLDAVLRIVNEETGQPVENPVEKVLRLGRVVGLANHTVLIARDGARRPIDDSAAPIRAEDG